MSSLVVLERHLWLTLTEMKEADKVPFLDAPVSSNSLFRPAVRASKRASRNGLRRLRSRLKRCNTSSQNAPVLLLLVAPSLRRLSSPPSQSQPLQSPYLLRVGRIEGVPARQDATRSASDPGLRLPWIRRLRSPPDQPGRKRRGQSLAIARPPRKQPLMCLLSPRSALGAEESVFLVIARRDCTRFPYSILRRSTSGISKGNILGYYRNLGSLRYGNKYCVPGRAMSCTPQSLHSKTSVMRWRSGRLYSQRPRPFWRALAGCIAIGLLIAAAEPLVQFYSTARTNGRAVSLRD